MSIEVNKALFKIMPSFTSGIKSQISQLLKTGKSMSGEAVERLKKKLGREIKMNLETLNKFEGRRVEMGESVQFLHVQSRKYLSYDLENTSNDKENFKLGLSEICDDKTMFVLQPW